MEQNVTAPVVEAATQEDLNEWWRIAQELDKLKPAEMQLRKKIYATYFQAPEEGTNKCPLTQGWVLKAQCVITRKVDKPLLTTNKAELEAAGIAVDSLVEWKPELKVSEYRKLSDEQRKLFDKCLDIKEGSPQLDIVLPKR